MRSRFLASLMLVAVAFSVAAAAPHTRPQTVGDRFARILHNSVQADAEAVNKLLASGWYVMKTEFLPHNGHKTVPEGWVLSLRKTEGKQPIQHVLWLPSGSAGDLPAQFETQVNQAKYQIIDYWYVAFDQNYSSDAGLLVLVQDL